MSLPPILASKFILIHGNYIHPTMIATNTETSITLHDGTRYEK